MKTRFGSIRGKLILLVALSSGLAAVLVSATLIARHYDLLLELARDHLQTQADLIAIHSAATLAFDDQEAARKTLEALRAIPEIGAAEIYNLQGEPFAVYRGPPSDKGALPEVDPFTPGIRHEGDWLVLNGKPIMATGDSEERLGMLTMVYDIGPLRDKARSSTLISLLLGAGATLIALFAGLLVNKVLARPLAELDRTARRVSRTRDYTVRAVKFADDELGQLTDVFNEMLAQVERKDAALIRAHERFRTAVEAAPNAMITVDTHGRIVMVNARTEEFFGYGRDELIGMSVDRLVPDRYRSAHAGFRDGFIRAPEARPMGAGRELSGLRKDGTEFPIEIGLNPIQTDEGLMVMGTIVDITERKRAEREREQLLESERIMRAEAEHASRMKDEFVATLSHELRSPLTAITGWAYMLRRLIPSAEGAGHEAPAPSVPLESSEIAQGLDIIERNARVQTQLIEDLLDMSRIVSGKIRLDVQEVELPEVIEQALSTVEPAARAKEIRVQKIIDPRVTPARGDPARLQQIVWNLVSNAIKFTPRHGRVQVVLQRINSHVEIVVGDTGEGIASEFLPHIFERFRQADASTTRKHGGLGLGLAIVKHLVELHGGTVTASSAGTGMGATFTVKLPLAILHPRLQEEERVHPRAMIPEAATEAEAVGVESLKQVRVLIVEDEPDARELICHLLELSEARVYSASSADEGLKAMDTFRPDVVVSDIGMPGKDGYQFIREVRARPATQGGMTPAIALTAFARSEDRTRALVAGYQMHVAKPVNPTELIASVASMAGLVRRPEV